MLRKAKFDYYQNINLGNLTDNRKFWKTVKPIFSDKVQVNSSLTVIENGKMINKDSEIAKIFNHHFATITDSLGISINDSVLLPTDGILQSVAGAARSPMEVLLEVKIFGDHALFSLRNAHFEHWCSLTIQRKVKLN